MKNRESEKEEYTRAEVFSAVARKTYLVFKVLFYICIAIACAAAISGVILASTNAIEKWSVYETLLFFFEVSIYASISAILIKNVGKLFRDMANAKSPFCEKAGRYITKTARYIFILSVVPALIGNVAIGILNTSSGLESELRFKFGYTGILAGVITLFLSMVFDYGYELQQKADEKEK